MNVPAMSLELHERGIHVVCRDVFSYLVPANSLTVVRVAR
jgi:hypothetical protein